MAVKLLAYLRSRILTGAGITAIGGGACIAYQDMTRYTKIQQRYSHGHILPPVSDDTLQNPYCRRPADEKRINQMLGPRFTNEYYLVTGEVGTGKSRIVIESVRELMKNSGAIGHGAPVYVIASQGKSFPDTLAAAVNFSFDEHISFTFFINFLLGLHSMPKKDDSHKLRRVLDAIEEAAYIYMKKTGKPAVLVFDDVSYLANHLPVSLDRLQEKAKIWADTNVAKVIFIANDEQTEVHLQGNRSSWSRADEPIYIGDLSEEEAIGFLMAADYDINTNKAGKMEKQIRHSCIDRKTAYDIVNQVGGRPQYLLQIRRDMSEGLTMAEAIARQKGKEKEKLLVVIRSSSSVEGLKTFLQFNDKKMTLAEFMGLFKKEDFKILFKHNVLSIKREGSTLTIKFYSKLTETVLEEWVAAKHI